MLNMKERLLFLFCLRERIYIYREIEREALGVLSLPQESKEEKRMRKREAGVVRKTNPFRGVYV